MGIVKHESVRMTKEHLSSFLIKSGYMEEGETIQEWYIDDHTFLVLNIRKEERDG